MTTTDDAVRIASRLRTLAEAQAEKIAYLRRPMTQASTPKRQREYASRVIDGDNLERCRLAMLALAGAWDRGDLPPLLTGLRTKDEIGRLVRHGTNSSGYYSVYSTHQYVDQTPIGKALQSLLDASLGTGTRAEQEATRKKREVESLIDKVRFADIPGFFPTPPAIAAQMLAAADLHPGQMVLEPSAGIGSLADAIAAAVKVASDPGPDAIRLTCIEIRASLCDILRAKGHDVIANDFLEVSASKPAWDRIVMNPPFEGGQDMAHIQHAFKMLKPGGGLVSIVSPGPFFRNHPKAVEFRAWLQETGATVTDLPANSFSSPGAFRSTGVGCKMIVVNAPAAAPRPAPPPSVSERQRAAAHKAWETRRRNAAAKVGAL